MYAGHCKKQKPRILSMRGFQVWCLTVTYFHTGRPALSSAQGRFTVLFGMGRGGSTLLWPSGIDLPGDPKAPTIRNKAQAPLYCFFLAAPSTALQGHGDKPHGRLVTVSSTCRHASTPVLSTSWSRTALQGGQASGKSHLEAGFPLRCLQRLSLPDLATRQCHWRDNRCTRGPSTPVLSY